MITQQQIGLNQFREKINRCIKRSEDYLDEHDSREMEIVKEKLQEAKMWLGKVLELTGRKK